MRSFPRRSARRRDVQHGRHWSISLFAVFHASESFLSYQRGLEEGRKTSNCQSLFTMTAIPTDNHIRAMLDPVSPTQLQPAFDATWDALRQNGGLVPFQRLGGRILIALDGTEYFCSQKLRCPQCQTRQRANGKVENESFNVLKSNGYHLEHNFGHGKQNLAMMLATMNLLAFAIHTVCDCLEQLWINARTAERARKRFFEHIKTITAYLVSPDWPTLMQTLINSKPPPEIAAQVGL